MLAAVSGIGGPAPGLAPVIVTDRARPADPSTAMLSGVFGFTPGKADVASSLARDRSAEEVARLLVLASKMEERETGLGCWPGVRQPRRRAIPK